MPRRFRGRRRYNGKRRRYYGRGFLGTAGKALSVATTALAVAKGVKGLMNVEYKVIEAGATDSVLSTGAVTLLTPIAEGDDYSQRNGRSVKAKRINFRGMLKHDSGGDACQFVRIMIVNDLHQDGTIPAVTDILNSADYNSFREISDADRFRVLFDKTVTVTANNEGKVIRFNKDLNHKVEFINTTAAQASMGGGTLYLLLIGSQITSNYPTLDWITRFRYIDN